MGYNCTALALVGVMVNKDKLYNTKKVRGCSHELRNESDSFCGVCGAKAWFTGKEPISACEAKFGIINSVAGYPVHIDCEKEMALIYCASASVDNGSCGFDKYEKDIDMGAAKKEMESKLSPLGLWDEKKFGMWAVLEESY